jgi:hypothetical protein
MGWWFPVDKPTPDKQVIAGKIRAALEKRLGTLLGCNGRDLPKMRLGELVHLAFLLWDGEEIGGFNPTVSAILQLVGRDIMWAKVEEEPKAEETVVVN